MKISKFLGRSAGFLLALAMTFPAIPADLTKIADLTASAAVNWKFDFGAAGTASGYTGVTASDAYDKSKGYGFADTSHVADVSASGKDANSDAVRFTSTDSGNTFNVDLPKGLYQITVTTGDTTRTSIRAENMLQLINLTGNNAVETFQIPVTDGQLNIMATEGRAGTYFSISSIEITQLNTTAEMNPTIWLCGDSTVANYYNTPDTAQHGWGQFLKNYLPSAYAGYEVRNMAASGQYAKGFVDAGQFDAIEAYGKAGDYYIISIGINDTNYSNADEYYQTVTDMVKRAKAKGMTVILVKQQGRRSDLNRDKLLSGRWFGGQMDQIGTEQNVKVIDLFTPWQDFGLSLGFDAMGEYYATDDDLHQSKTGSMKLASLMAELAFAKEAEPGAQIPENQIFMLRNGNSGQYLAVDGIQDGANVYQSADPDLAGQSVLWKAIPSGDGYYYLYHCGGDGTKLLDLANGDPKNGTNIGIWGNTNSDAQLFKFIPQDNGSYVIVTKSSKDQSAVEVVNASAEHQGNIQQWERNGHDCQTWFIDSVQTAVSDHSIPGDMNQDGIVNIYDTLLLKQKIKQNTVTHDDRKTADLNGDTVLDSQDVNSFLNYLHKGVSDFQNTGRKVYYAADAG
ncbi:MAG: RICIN domain-containing protein, partial [Oscillospiraceae bacterium]|nr:RICIN domain-containing protein [Oscillospiraceae bacterium]